MSSWWEKWMKKTKSLAPIAAVTPKQALGKALA